MLSEIEYLFHSTARRDLFMKISRSQLTKLIREFLLKEEDIELTPPKRTATEDATKEKSLAVLKQQYQVLSRGLSSIPKMKDEVRKLPQEKRKTELARIESLEDKYSSDMAKLQSDSRKWGTGAWEEVRGVKSRLGK
jgi:hypothetical protein